MDGGRNGEEGGREREREEGKEAGRVGGREGQREEKHTCVGPPLTLGVTFLSVTSTARLLCRDVT